MKRWIACCVLMFGCEAESVEPDAGPPPRPEPFVCPNPAWSGPTEAPSARAPRPRELAIDRSVDRASAAPFDPETIPLDEALFDLGVQSGAVTSESARVWTHTTAGSVQVRVWRRDGAQVLLVPGATPLTPADGFVQTTLTGLAPATRYSYAFFANLEGAVPARSTVGHFTTAPPAGARARVKIAATTCTNQSQRPFEALTAMASEDIDVFLQVGDYTYNDGSRTTEQYRARWRDNLGDPGYRALLAAAGGYFTWDDHEIIDSGDYYTIEPEVRAAGVASFFEHVPVDRRPGTDTFWNAYAWGDAVDFIVLDSRSERVPATRMTDGAQYISEAQFAFVTERLRASTARFKLVLNSVPIANLPANPWLLAEDRWQGYEAQRRRLLDFIAQEGIEGVWFISGDFHMGYVARLDVDGPHRGIWEIAVGPGDARNPNPVPLLVNDRVVPLQRAFPCEMFTYWSAATRATTTIEIDPVAETLQVRFVDPVAGTVLYDQTFVDP